jgi:hypothetical protein
MRTLVILICLALFGCGVSDQGGEIEYIEGPPGPQGEAGQDGDPGPPGQDGLDGETGPQGESGEDGQDGVDGIDGMDGAPGPGTRIVLSGTVDSTGYGSVALDTDLEDLVSITAWVYEDDPNGRIFGTGWYEPAMAVTDEGDLEFQLSGVSNTPFRVVIIE